MSLSANIPEITASITKITANLVPSYSRNIRLEDKFAGDLGFDSISRLELLMDIEMEFDIDISDEEASGIITVADAVTLVTAKVAVEYP